MYLAKDGQAYQVPTLLRLGMHIRYFSTDGQVCQVPGYSWAGMTGILLQLGTC